MIGGRVLDTSALLAFARGTSVYAAAAVWTAVEESIVLIVPSTAITAALTDLADEHRPVLDVLLHLPVTVIDNLNEARTRTISQLGGHQADAHAVACAQDRNWPLLTANPTHYARYEHTSVTVESLHSESAFILAYDAARFVGEALLAQQGLRPTQAGGHLAVSDAIRAQFGGPLSGLGALRRRRNELEYPAFPGEHIDIDEVTAAITTAQNLLDTGRDRRPAATARPRQHTAHREQVLKHDGGLPGGHWSRRLIEATSWVISLSESTTPSARASASSEGGKAALGTASTPSPALAAERSPLLESSIAIACPGSTPKRCTTV